MRTEAYKELFAYSLKEGHIPQDVYDWIIGEIDANDGKLTLDLYNRYLAELEKRRLFDADGTPFNTENSAQTDGTYVYKHEKNVLWHIGHAFTSTVFKLIGWIVGPLGYGVWRVKDRKKLKKLRSFITLSNHMGYIDAAVTRRAMGNKKQYIVAAPHNCKNNLGGRILASATVIPLPTSFKGLRPFGEMLEYVAGRGAAIHFYAEKSMWLHYQKPRPYKDGAFYYADKLDLPVVVMLYCFKQPRGLRKLFRMPKVVVKIADPIYADKSLSPRERQKDLAKRADAAVRGLYEEFYGKPLEYLPRYPSEVDGDGEEKSAEQPELSEQPPLSEIAERGGTEEPEEQNAD